METNPKPHRGWLSRSLFTPLFGLAAAALVAAPSLARAQILYVSARDQTIKKIDSTGAVSHFASLPSNSLPAGLAFDGSGNLYAADTYLGQISKITSDGSVSLFVALPSNYSEVIEPDGTIGVIITLNIPPYDPVGLAFDGSGNLYSSDSFAYKISKISSDGLTINDFVAPYRVFSPQGLAFDGNGNLYVTDSSFFGNLPSKITKISPDGNTTSLFATLPGSFNPRGLAFDGSANLYVADSLLDEISKITPDGTVSLFATLPSGSSPVGLAFDDGGNLYVADSGSNQISKITPDGLTVSTFATGIINPQFIAISPVPEPSAWAMLAAGTASLLALRRRKRNSA